MTYKVYQYDRREVRRRKGIGLAGWLFIALAGWTGWMQQPRIERLISGRAVHYPNCKAVRAAGAAPLLSFEPGYRPTLDADRDGIACEPYTGN